MQVVAASCIEDRMVRERVLGPIQSTQHSAHNDKASDKIDYWGKGRYGHSRYLTPLMPEVQRVNVHAALLCAAFLVAPSATQRSFKHNI